jgi:DUF2075 family protein
VNLTRRLTEPSLSLSSRSTVAQDMRLYAGAISEFVSDATRNEIAGILTSSFRTNLGRDPAPSERHSWNNSLVKLKDVVTEAQIHKGGILLEFQLPFSGLRLDAMLTGRGADGVARAEILELKQWDSSGLTDVPDVVTTRFGKALVRTLHPSVQVGRYARYLAEGHTAFYGDDSISLGSLAYLHNYHPNPSEPLLDPRFSSDLSASPLYFANDFDRLSERFASRLADGGGLAILKRIDEGSLRPSKKLMDHVSGVIRGTPEYILLDEQLVAFQEVATAARAGLKDRQKRCLIIRGGPGTGKSVIALNLMAALLKEGMNARHATGSAAFTSTLRRVVGNRAEVQFDYFNSYSRASENSIDVLIADEAHRIRKSSASRYTKKAARSDTPQVEELLRVSRVSVFLIDDLQTVRPGEVGSTDLIRTNADRLGIPVSTIDLTAQFRCRGSDSFVQWLDSVLGLRISDVARLPASTEFDFRIVDSPQELDTLIHSRAIAGDTARMTAGFCWPWNEPNSDGSLPLDVQIGEFKRPWNAKANATHLARSVPSSSLWAHDSRGLNQIGCVYTAQGFEFDYAGVIWGDDVVWEPDSAQWVGDPKKSEDSVVRRAGPNFLSLALRTYRVLLSRGIKGCYVFFTDPGTRDHFRSLMDQPSRKKSD